MARSSISGGDDMQEQTGSFDQVSLGPSDTSDSGSDVAGSPDQTAGDEMPLNDGPLDLDRTATTRSPAGAGSDTDSTGTGERLGAEPNSAVHDGSDISPDRIIGGADDELDGETLSLDDVGDIAADDGEED
ncbi:hypothetical protein BH09PSE5_BH09PSE5_19310 [soil metagenome]